MANESWGVGGDSVPTAPPPSSVSFVAGPKHAPAALAYAARAAWAAGDARAPMRLPLPRLCGDALVACGGGVCAGPSRSGSREAKRRATALALSSAPPPLELKEWVGAGEWSLGKVLAKASEKAKADPSGCCGCGVLSVVEGVVVADVEKTNGTDGADAVVVVVVVVVVDGAPRSWASAAEVVGDASVLGVDPNTNMGGCFSGGGTVGLDPPTHRPRRIGQRPPAPLSSGQHRWWGGGP